MRRRIDVNRISAKTLRELSPRTLQAIHEGIRTRHLTEIGVHWKTHFYVSWPPNGDLVIYTDLARDLPTRTPPLPFNRPETDAP